MDHPLDRPIWTALTTRQESLAQVAGGIRRFRPEYAPFASTAEGTPESLVGLDGLVPEGGVIVLQQAQEVPAPPGLVLTRVAETVQMVAGRAEGRRADFTFEDLTLDDAPQMRALASLTNPGPFSTRTHELGRFVGIRVDDVLVAMAGERMKAGAFTEISGVCTHPDHRGKGYAAGLMREIGHGIVERGETPFLHAFADNHEAIRLYEKLGFSIRWRPLLLVFSRA